MSARFRVKIARWKTTRPFLVHDARRPAFFSGHATLDAAMLAIDNTVRAERGMPKRPALTRREIREAMGRDVMIRQRASRLSIVNVEEPTA